ncbi:MAG TPA: hypothetical protein VEY91_00095, partial [Candidatus Limnocylindria bacterium]|nr:hypothetical protein [Candidatus Limnocylindria bacterium]
MSRFWAIPLAAALALSGCDDSVSPRDVTPPAAPRGFRTVTGDGRVYLSWLDNTEHDVAGYRLYVGSCDDLGCPYTFAAATTENTHTLSSLANGVTRYFAVAAVDREGNESDLSYDTVFDTPRPEDFDQPLTNYLSTVAGSGYDFSAYRTRDYDDPATDIFFGSNGSIHQMFVPDFNTDIQDAGYAANLDAVDFAPSGGWSPSGTVELIVGHCYVVWTRDDHFAKFRVTALTSSAVRFDWAYQTDAGNPELKAQRARDEDRPGGVAPGRRPIYWAR